MPRFENIGIGSSRYSLVDIEDGLSDLVRSDTDNFFDYDMYLRLVLSDSLID